MSNDGIQTMDRCKEDFAKWNAAVSLQAAGDYQEALQLYHSMHEISARIYYNMAVAYINVGDIELAVKCLTTAVEKDTGLAIAFFQRGTLHLERQAMRKICGYLQDEKDLWLLAGGKDLFTKNSIRSAITDLETTRMLLRGNTFINYRPLGLFCHLHDFAILYNLALANLLEGEAEEFRVLMTEAMHNADFFQREQISSTLRLFKKNRWSEIQPIHVTTDAVFIPPKEVTKNLEPRKSSKRSKVVFASDEKDNTPTFRGTPRIDELRKSTHHNRSLTDHQTSMKRKLFRKMKSTGDIKIPVGMHRNYSTERKRHSFGGSDSSSTSTCTMSNFSVESQQYSSGNVVIKKDSSGADAVNSGDKKADESLPKQERNNEAGSDISKVKTCKMRDDFVDSVEITTNEKKDENSTYSQQAEDAVSKEIKTFQKDRMFSSDKSSPDRKRRFKRKTKSAGDIKGSAKQNKILGRSQGSRSTGDLEKARNKSLLPLERGKKSPTSLTSLKQRMKPKVDKDGFDGSHPTVVMHGCKAAGNVLTMLVPIDSCSGDNDRKTEHVTDKENFDVNNNEKNLKLDSKSKYSLGSVFGDRSTVVKYALTEACDVLTASITPTIDESDVKPYVCQRKKNTLKQNCQDISRYIKNEHTMITSRKKKRAPDPPMSVIRPHLIAAGQLITALVHVEAEADTTMNKGDIANVAIGGTNVKGGARPKQSHQAIYRKNKEVSNDVLKEDIPIHTEKHKRSEVNDSEKAVSENYGHTSHSVREVIFEETNTTVHLQNLTLRSGTSKDTPGSNGEPNALMCVNTESVKEGIAKGNKKKRSDSLRKNDREDNSATDSGDKNIERYKDLEPLSSSNGSLRQAKLPPPSYPPPPLRPFHWKKQKKKGNRKERNDGLNGLVGDAILASGKMLGVVVDAAISDAAFDSDAYSLRTSKLNKTMKSETQENQSGFNILKESTCNRGQESDVVALDEGEHEYVNVTDTFGKCGNSMNTGNACLNNVRNMNTEGVHGTRETCGNRSTAINTLCNCNKDKTNVDLTVCTSFKHLTLEDDVVPRPTAFSCLRKRRARQGPEQETINKTLMTSHDLLTAFVTSNQETRRAFEAFVQEQSNNTKRRNSESLNGDGDNEVEHDYINVDNEIGHDYVNVSRL